MGSKLLAELNHLSSLLCYYCTECTSHSSLLGRPMTQRKALVLSHPANPTGYDVDIDCID